MPQMNPPPVSPRLCHRTSGASIALGGGRGPGDESARPLCSRHFQRTDTTAPVSGRSEVDTQAPGRGWAVGPPRAVGCRNRGSPLYPLGVHRAEQCARQPSHSLSPLLPPWWPELLVCGTHFVPHTIPPGAGCLAAAARPGPPLAAGGQLGRGAPSSFLPLVRSH